jgi:NADH-quinone oxidoreductase subunit E
MAWIVQDRAHEQIERRAEPYLTEAMKQQLEREVIPKYEWRRAALLPVCHTVQHEHGWLPPQALEEIAEFLGISYADMLDTVSFYEEFHLEPSGRYAIQICRSISCELCGHREISKRAQRKLDVLPGETTDDGKFTLMEIECIGACEQAPAALVDEKLHGNLTWESLEALIDSLPDD